MNSYPYIVEPIYNYRRFRREGKRQIKKNTGGRAENGHYKMGRTETVTRRISQQKKKWILEMVRWKDTQKGASKN